eukprot:976181-Amphidinium_carterae.2
MAGVPSTATQARPTVAPTTFGVEDVVYSPINAPSPQVIESSSSSVESTASDLVCGVEGLSTTEALEEFLVQQEMNPGKTGRFWKEDEMHYKFMHTSVATVKQMLSLNSLGNRFLYGSRASPPLPLPS